MTVAPIPIVPLHSVVLPVVLTIGPVFCRQVTPVGAVLVVVPVVVITVVPIIDSHLDAAFLRSRMSQDCGWCSNGSSQEYGTDVAIHVAHDVVLQAGDTQIQNPVRHHYAPLPSLCMFCSAHL